MGCSLGLIVLLSGGGWLVNIIFEVLVFGNGFLSGVVVSCSFVLVVIGVVLLV